MAESVSSDLVSGFAWKIKDVLSTNRLESDEFTSHESRWRLVLCIGDDSITVSLNRLSPEKLIGRYKVRCSAEDACKRPIESYEFTLKDPDFATREIWWISTYEIQRYLDKYPYRDTILTFMTVFVPLSQSREDEREKSIQTSISMDSVACFENLSLELRRLLDDGVQTDVTLKCGERAFPAHRIILSARSEVFSAMFRSGMVESQSGIVQITDMDASVLDQLMRYIYSGEISDLSIENAPALCMAADKYRIEFLKNMCVKFIRENLTRENACEMLVFADVSGFKDLKDSVMRFITSVQLLRNEDIWNKFLEEHPKLATGVLHHAYAEKCDSNAHDVASAQVCV